MLLLVTALLCVTVSALPEGAPVEACADMMPQHEQDPSTDPNPYLLDVSQDPCPASGADCYEVTISGSSAFRGFFIQARYIGDEDPSADQTPQGFFEITDTDSIQHRDCLGESDQDAVTHTNNEDKTSISVHFNPDGADVGGMQIVATVVQVHGVFWYAMRIPVE